jgi:hypothetical protein
MILRNKKEKLVLIVAFLLTNSLVKYFCKNHAISHLSNRFATITQNEEIRDEIAKKIKIFCWFIGKPNQNQTWIHLKKLWGHKCDRYVAMVSEEMPRISGMEVIKLQIPDKREGPGNLWKNYLIVMDHLHHHFIDDYDYFMKVDEDA